MNFLTFLEQAEKELTKSSHEEYHKNTDYKKIKTVSMPSLEYIPHEHLEKMLGKPEQTPIGKAWHYKFKGHHVALDYNPGIGRHQVRGEDESVLKDFRHKMVHAHNKRHPGTIDDIKKSGSAVAGKETY